MASDLVFWLAAIPVSLLLVVVLALIALVVIAVISFIIFVCVTNFDAWWRSPRMRLFWLGGVTTLSRRLNYRCTMCQDSMDAGDKVRTLSCDHVFHCGGTEKCVHGIDGWLLGANAMVWRSCPVCRQVPHPVLPWRRPPASSPGSDSEEEESEEELLFPSHWFDDTLAE